MWRYVRRVVVGVALSVLVALVAWAYSYNSPMTPRASKEWSRGRVIGRTAVNRPVAIRPAPDGGVFLVWPNQRGYLELTHVGVDGEVLLDRVLSVGTGAANDPQLQIGPEGRLCILWREMGEPHATVRYALVEADGTIAGRSRILSDPDRWVEGAPRLVLDAEGRLHALWTDGTGIQWAVMSIEGDILRPPTLLVPEGLYPAVQVDRDGRLHLAWQRWTGRNTRGMYYAVLDPESGEMSEPEQMAQVFRRAGRRIEGPVVGLDPDTGYVLWSAVDVRDVSAQSQYAFFPLDLPRQKRVRTLYLKEGTNPSGLYVLDGQRMPLLVTLSEMVGSGWEAELQVAVVALVRDQTPEYEVWGLAQAGGRGGLLASGRPSWSARLSGGWEPAPSEWEAEHVVTASNMPSIRPVLVVDNRSFLHLVWLEPGGFDQYRVIYASTAPEVKQNYNAITLWDVVDPVFRHVFRLSLVVLAIGPMIVFWALIPMGLLLVYHLVTGEEELDTMRSRAMLGAVLALEVVLTIWFPPALSFPWLPLRWVLPVATAALAAVVTAWTMRDKEESVLFLWFFLFTGINSLVQLAVYYLL